MTPGDVKHIVEGLGYIDRVLTEHCVNDKQYLVGADRIFDVLKLLHHLLVDVETTRRYR